MNERGAPVHRPVPTRARPFVQMPFFIAPCLKARPLQWLPVRRTLRHDAALNTNAPNGGVGPSMACRCELDAPRRGSTMAKLPLHVDRCFSRSPAAVIAGWAAGGALGSSALLLAV